MYRIVVQANCNFAPNFKTNDMEEDEIALYTIDQPMYMMPNQISGLCTGYYSLNSLLSGWQNGEYVIVGYTKQEDANEFIGNNTSAMSRGGSKVAVFAPNKDITYSVDVLEKTIVLLDCDSIVELRKRARCLVRKDSVKALLIKNLTLLNCQGLKFGSQGNKYSQISRSLCQLCTELNIPIISLVPITTADEIPELSCFKNIGNLEKNADIVIFLTRNERDKLTPLVAKNRNGGISDSYC